MKLADAVLFFPAAGHGGQTDGDLKNSGIFGGYLSSSLNGTYHPIMFDFFIR